MEKTSQFITKCNPDSLIGQQVSLDYHITRARCMYEAQTSLPLHADYTDHNYQRNSSGDETSSVNFYTTTSYTVHALRPTIKFTSLLESTHVHSCQMRLLQL